MMGEKTGISYADHTFSPWWGCAKVSLGCKNCSAETVAKRLGVFWGPNARRMPIAESTWRQPLAWDRKAARDGVRRRVLTSMCDVFEDRRDLDIFRMRFITLMERTPNLDWLLLTKRPENMVPMTGCWKKWPDNVWAGATVENQEMADLRISPLLEVPARMLFLSTEPLLNSIDFDGCWLAKLDWIVIGCERGRYRRPCPLAWVESIVAQCQTAAVPVFVKQLNINGRVSYNPAEWPENLRIMQYPQEKS